MEKIPTIFERDWEGNRKVVDKLALFNFDFSTSTATEKLDGTNIRVTVRNHHLVRLEKRRNPSKREKDIGISDPWYIDADPGSSVDKHIFDAANNTDLSNVPDGEWSAEALGEKIQGNPLSIKGHTLFIFSLADWRKKITYENVPTEFNSLRNWLLQQKSKFGMDCGIEGIVWHNNITGEMCKIKISDFEYRMSD